MRRPSSLAAFLFTAIAGFFLLTLAWMQVSNWTSFPASGIAHIALGVGARDWVRSIEKTPGMFVVDTRIGVKVPGQEARGTAELVVEADPARHAYGLPLYFALLIAARSRRFLRNAIAGYFVLLLPQAFSLSLDVLAQILGAGKDAATLGIAPWQMEAIALGYQVGVLLLPTVAPTVLWLYLERQFLAAVLFDGMLRKEASSVHVQRQ